MSTMSQATQPAEPTASGAPRRIGKVWDYVRNLGTGAIIIGGTALALGTVFVVDVAYPWVAERSKGIVSYARSGTFQYVEPRTHPYDKVNVVLGPMDESTKTALEEVCPLSDFDIGVRLYSSQYNSDFDAILRMPNIETSRKWQERMQGKKRVLVEAEQNLLFDPSYRVCEIAGKKVWPLPWGTYRMRVNE